jgi:pimeloyl-ACP methyl ester carboxylesterase
VVSSPSGCGNLSVKVALQRLEPEEGTLDMAVAGNITVVAVHGAWADGSSWKDVILGLEREGLRVVAAPIPLTSLGDDIAALKRAVARAEGPVILAGHAYAGAVVAAVNDEHLKALVYIAGLAPDEGETVAQVFYRDEPHAQAPHLAPDADGFIWMPDDGFRKAFAQHATAEQIAVSAAVQRPILVKCIQEPVPRPAWKSKSSWYLIAEEDRMINPKTQHFMAQRMGATTRSLAVDHTPLLSAPQKVVDIIMEAKQGVFSERSDGLSMRISSGND